MENENIVKLDTSEGAEPGIKELLEKDIELSEENHKLLKRMEFTSRISTIINVAKWVIIIGSALGIYYYLGPDLEKLMNVYKNIPSMFQ